MNNELRITNDELQARNREPKIGSRELRDALFSTAPRYEMKIPLPVYWLSDVEAWVRVHPAHWRVAFPSRQVNNVYFDTCAFDGLNANLSGIAERVKLRLRWYGADVVRVAHAQLELKCKRGSVGWKEIVPVDGALDLVGVRWRAFDHALRAVLGPRACGWLDVFGVPVLINCYRRAYYTTPDGMLRLTIDSALRAYDQRALAMPNLRRPAYRDVAVVVELKAGADAESTRRLSMALAHFPAPVGRFSKYVQGVSAVPDF